MDSFDHRIAAIAAMQRNLVTRADVRSCGGPDHAIQVRVERGSWRVVHPGVYCIAPAPLDWHARLLAATLAAGQASVVSARAGLVVYGTDALRSAPLEITVPYTSGAAPEGVIVHRSRRVVHETRRHGIPLTSIERTLLDAAAFVPPVVVEKALHSATLLGLTTPEKVLAHVNATGARGVKGARRVRAVVAEFGLGRPARSGGEVVIGRVLRELRQHGIEDPIRNYPLTLPDGSEASLDFAWPLRTAAMEFDGIEGHSSIRDVDYDDYRQNQIFDAGWALRRFGWPTTSRRPQVVVQTMLRLLLCRSAAA